MDRRLHSRPVNGSVSLRAAWRRSIPGLFAIFLFSAFINVLKLAVPLYIFQLLDRVLSSRSIETLIMLTAIVLCAVLAGALAEFIRRGLLMRWGVWIEQQFGKSAFVVGLSGNNSSRPSKLLRDLASLRGFVSGGAAVAWLDVMWAPIFIIVVYLIHPAIASIVGLSIALQLLLGYLNEVTTRQTRASAAKATLENNDWVAVAERNAEIVGALNMSRNLADRWYESAQVRLSENLRTKVNTVALTDLMRLIETLQRIACYALGVYFVIAGSLSVGGVIAAAVLGRIASSQVRRAMAKWRNLASARAAYQRIKKRFDEDARAENVQLDQSMALPLTFANVSHRYPDQVNSIFRRLDATVAPGEILCVQGRSGSGKTTIANLAAGALKPRSGSIRIGDVDISRYSADELSQYVGYLHEDVRLFHGSIAENIAGMGEVDVESVVEAAELAGLHDIVVSLPQGYETVVGDDACRLSGGERKRIALARAFYDDPLLIVLDEPEVNLDEAACGTLVDALLTCRSRRAAIVIMSQSDAIAAIADKVLKLGRSTKVNVTDRRSQIEDMRRRKKARKSGDQPATQDS